MGPFRPPPLGAWCGYQKPLVPELLSCDDMKDLYLHSSAHKLINYEAEEEAAIKFS